MEKKIKPDETMLITNYPNKRILYLGIPFSVAENYLKDASKKAFLETLLYLLAFGNTFGPK